MMCLGYIILRLQPERLSINQNNIPKSLAMNKIYTTKLSLVLLGFILSCQVMAQNLETMFIEKMDNASYIVPEQCTPEDFVILINSSIPGLKFESNMLPAEEFVVSYNEQSNQYIICHERIKFKLTVSGPNLQSEDIEVFDLDKPQAYRISANTAKGKVNILTNPRNATVIFPDLNNLVLSSNQPITNVSGKYRVNIVKAQYKNVDTTVVIPRDAEKTYNINLIPLFSRIKLDLRTDDNSAFLKAPVLIIDSVRLELDALVKPGMNQRSFFDDVEFFKFYEGNIIPLNEGQHSVRIEAESYIPYENTFVAKNGKVHNMTVSLEPIFGYLTFVDKQFAEGAEIFVNDISVGKVPMFKVKARVGTHKIKFEKSGYIPSENEYSITVQENQNSDIDVSMQVARKINFETDPSSAEVLMDGSRIGFTPVTSLANAGEHDILIKKSGFATEKIVKLINETTPDEETVKVKLRSVNPLDIRSEREGLLVNLVGTKDLRNIEIDNTLKSPASIPLPYGKYKISLTDGNKVYYKSTINHSSEIIKRGKIPCYSKSSFHVLSGNYVNKDNFEASFGRIVVFPGSGLSSALINVDYMNLDSTRVMDVNNILASNTMSFQDTIVRTLSANYGRTLAPNIFFLNWDWRIGGSVFRQLDVNFLGRAKYTPGLKFVSVNIPDFSDVEMQYYFYGIEVSSRWSGINLNFRFGKEIKTGNLNYWDEKTSKYSDVKIPIKEDRLIASVGITLNGKVFKSNNMLRLWNKPLVDLSRKETKVNNGIPSPDNFSGIKLFQKKNNQ